MMILIALAIILLCKSSTQFQRQTTIHLTDSTTALLLAGCSSSSPLIPSIYLISFYYPLGGYLPTFSPVQVNPGVYANQIAQIVGDTCLEVRVGYFGLCVTADGTSWLCSNNATLLALQIEPQQDPLNLLYVASTFKDLVVFPYLL